MRPFVLPLLVVGACETGGKVVITDEVPTVDTDLATDSSDDGDDSDDDDGGKPPVDDDTGEPPGVDTAVPNPFSAPRLAWDGVVRVTHKAYVGPDCVVRHVERGEEIGPGALRDRLAAACPSCDRFFAVTETETGWCLTTYQSGSWRGLELRPTGDVVATWLGEDDRGTLTAWNQGAGPLQGTTFSFARNASGFPFNSVEQIRGTVTLTPIP